jgi:hypothetical protein
MTTGYTIAQLKAAMAFAKAHPTNGRIRVHFAPMEPVFTGDAWRAWFRTCLMRKINRHEPCRGRKDCRDWFIAQWRASRELNHPRLIIDWLPADLAHRFAKRLRRNRSDL